MAYQAAPQCMTQTLGNLTEFKTRNGMGIPWYWSVDNRGSHVSLSNNRSTAIGNHYNW